MTITSPCGKCSLGRPLLHDKYVTTLAGILRNSKDRRESAESVIPQDLVDQDSVAC
ncbi:MAG: hypothetical protein MK110_04490 [Fuerstiella sp.]|nr:hypothetical protein [Fuerstiella sp.]